MRSRREILADLALFKGDIEVLTQELAQYPWDSEEPLFQINADHLVNTLRRSIIGEIDAESLAAWANAIECRDDLEFANERIAEAVFELASPEINGELTKERLGELAVIIGDEAS